jgi:hypothetical protein
MKQIVLALCLVVTGCGAMQQAQNAKAKADFTAAAKVCTDTYPAVVGNFVPRATCINKASIAADSTPAAGVIRAERMALSEKVDRGEITSSEASVQLARIVYELRDHERQEAAAAQANHQAAQAAAAPAWAGLAATGVGVATQPPHSNVTTCRWVAGTMVCTGN